MTKSIYFLTLLFIGYFQVSNAQSDEYIVGGDFDYAPFSFIDKNGKPEGISIEILNALTEETGITFKYNLSEWNKAISYIQSEKTAIITGIIFSKEREKFVDFTYPIHTENYFVFIRKNLPFSEISDLDNYKLMVLEGDVSIDKYLIPMGLYKNYSVVKSLPEALAAIEWGRADYVLAPYSVGMTEIEKNKYKNIDVKEPALMPVIYCFAVKKGNTHLLGVLNKGISALQNNGKLSEIQDKWLVYERGDLKYKRISSYIGVVLIIGIAGFIIGFIWVWQLRKQIKKKMESIKFKNDELQKSEEKFRIITENSSDIIWHIDSNFLLTYISPADERVRGFKSKDIIGNSLFSILKPEGIKLLMEANKNRINNQSNGIQTVPGIYELEELCKDGSWVWVEATATPFYDVDGVVLGYHGVTRDISERKKTELLLKQKEVQLRELILTKDKLFSIIAHDLRSPFNSILGFSDLLINATINTDIEKAKSFATMINTSAKNTLVLLDNLLNWSKSQSGKIKFEQVSLNLKPIIIEIFDILKSTADIKYITLNYDNSIEVDVYADENMLKTIVRNLISNAIKFTNTNGSVVVYAVQNENFIEITVSDNGIGLDEETLGKLFKIENNVTSKGTANEKGSGLGLILCEEFVDKLGGRIWIESELGKGSNFKFTIPRCIL
ncbi:MAG: transporter substrate-binding domain-containing protein [Lutibacter sp.]|nr:transporter substrate-binding domain-containing protein [Lutibacter sp.]MBP9600086.1 transporter substrate-binding domain-containing protein [Lutibacter sp.]